MFRRGLWVQFCPALSRVQGFQTFEIFGAHQHGADTTVTAELNSFTPIGNPPHQLCELRPGLGERNWLSLVHHRSFSVRSVQTVPITHSTYWGVMPSRLADARSLVAAAGVSALGDGVRLTLLPVLAAGRDGVVGTSLVLAAGYLPWLLFGLFAGAVADHIDQARAMVVIDFVRAILVTAFVLITFGRPAPLVLIAGLAFVLGSAETLFDSAAVTLLPLVAPADRLTALNGRLFSIQTLGSTLVGPGLGGLLYLLCGTSALLVDAGSFFAAAVLVGKLASHADVPSSAGPWHGLRSEVASGLGWLASRPPMRALMVLYAVLGAVSGALLAVLPTYTVSNLLLPLGAYGYLLAAFGIGSFTGGLLSPLVLRRMPAGVVLLGCACIAAAIFVAIASTGQAWLAATALALLGVAVATWAVTTRSLEQALVPHAVLGRVTAALRVSCLLLTLAGSLVAGPLVHLLGIDKTLCACALTVTLVTTLLMRHVRPLTITPHTDKHFGAGPAV